MSEITYIPGDATVTSLERVETVTPVCDDLVRLAGRVDRRGIAVTAHDHREGRK
ncbi:MULTISPECIES: hypothetical protein [unclassified Streptomyces]|uniref:hypothetical protein n=1 Tax=unclassified Streptomyces TaxID=2593676 RepID=UPI0036E140AF